MASQRSNPQPYGLPHCGANVSVRTEIPPSLAVRIANFRPSGLSAPDLPDKWRFIDAFCPGISSGAKSDDPAEFAQTVDFWPEPGQSNTSISGRPGYAAVCKSLKLKGILNARFGTLRAPATNLRRDRNVVQVCRPQPTERDFSLAGWPWQARYSEYLVV